MIKYFLGFIVIILIMYLIYSKFKVKETFVQDFDDVLDNKCSLLTQDQLDDYNFNSGNCQTSSCPLETCYELQEDVQQAKPVPTFKYFTNITEQQKQMNPDESFTCATNHNPEGNIFCNIDEPVCANLYDEKTCYEFTEDPENYINKSWKPYKFIKTINSTGDCLWVNTSDNSKTKTDIEMNNCKEEPFTCDDRRVSCTTYNANTPFNDNYQYFMVDPKTDGYTCIEDPERSCYEDCEIGKVQLLYKFDPNDRTFDPQIFTKQQRPFKNSYGEYGENVDLCLFLNNDGKCIPQQNSYGNHLQGYDDGDNAKAYCVGVGYAGYINDDPTNSNVLFDKPNTCYDKDVIFCSNLNDRDELIKDKYIPTLNNSDPTSCKYTNVQKSIDIVDTTNDPFVCPTFRACQKSDQFRNVEKGYCTPCPKGKFLDPRDDSKYKFTKDSACKDVASCPIVDKCFVPYRGADGEYLQNVLIEKDFPQTFNPDKPWECMETFKGECFKCPGPGYGISGTRIRREYEAGESTRIKNIFCSLCDEKVENGESPEDDTTLYDLNLKTKQCERVYQCPGGGESYEKCLNESTYTIHEHQYSNIDDKFTPCVYHKYYDDSSSIKSDYMYACPEPKCPENAFIEYIQKPYLCPPNSGCTDPQEKAMKEACQGAYVNKIGNIIGCERCELPLCTIIKEVETTFENSSGHNLESEDPMNYNILNDCRNNGECNHLPGITDPLNRSPYCNIKSVKKTFKFGSKDKVDDQNNYARCYYNNIGVAENIDNNQLDETDKQELANNVEYGIYETGKDILVSEISTNTEGCPKDCGEDRRITKEGNSFLKTLGGKVIRPSERTPLRDNQYSRFYVKDETCNDHDEPDKQGHQVDTITISEAQGKYGMKCDEYLMNAMITNVNNDIFKYQTEKNNTDTMGQCGSKINETLDTLNTSCELTKLKSENNIETWQIKKPYPLPDCKIDRTCIYTCDGGEHCEPETGNECLKIKRCARDEEDIDQAFGSGSTICPREGEIEIDGVYFAEYECPDSCPICPTTVSPEHDVYVIGSDSTIANITNDDGTKQLSESLNFIDPNKAKFARNDSHEFCHQDSPPPYKPIGDELYDNIYRLEKYHKDGDVCLDKDVSPKKTRKENEIKDSFELIGRESCEDGNLCRNIPLMKELNRDNTTAPTFVDGNLKLLKDTDLDDKKKICCDNATLATKRCFPGECASSFLEKDIAFVHTQNVYNETLCNRFINDGINELKDKTKSFDEVDGSTIFTSRYSHITVDRNANPPKITYYNLDNREGGKEDVANFTSKLGVDTYVNTIGGDGIDCNDDHYYDVGECCNGEKTRTFKPYTISPGVAHTCKSEIVPCNDEEDDICELGDPVVDCDIENGTYFKVYGNRQITDNNFSLDINYNDLEEAKQECLNNFNCKYIQETDNSGTKTFALFGGRPDDNEEKFLKAGSIGVSSTSPIQYKIYRKCPGIVFCTDSDYESGENRLSRTFKNFETTCPIPCDTSGTTYQRFKKESTCVGDDSIIESCPACDTCGDDDYEPCPSCGYGGGDAILKSESSCMEPSQKKQCPSTVSCESTCMYSKWGDWVPSTSKTCGTNVPLKRTRSINVGNSAYCKDTEQTKTENNIVCPCDSDDYYRISCPQCDFEGGNIEKTLWNTSCIETDESKYLDCPAITQRCCTSEDYESTPACPINCQIGEIPPIEFRDKKTDCVGAEKRRIYCLDRSDTDENLCQCIYSNWSSWSSEGPLSCTAPNIYTHTRTLELSRGSCDTDNLEETKEYKFYNTPVTWYEASKSCIDNGSKLITVTDDGDRAILYNIENQCGGDADGVWIGAVKYDTDYSSTPSKKNYKWIDQSTPINYSSRMLNWMTGEPNGDHRRAKVLMYKNGRLNDIDPNGSYTKPYICKKDPSGSANITNEARIFTNSTR